MKKLLYFPGIGLYYFVRMVYDSNTETIGDDIEQLKVALIHGIYIGILITTLLHFF
jgi:hypothetical protein